MTEQPEGLFCRFSDKQNVNQRTVKSGNKSDNSVIVVSGKYVMLTVKQEKSLVWGRNLLFLHFNKQLLFIKK